MLIDRQMDRVRIQQQHALMVIAMGGDADVPSMDDELAAFEDALAAPVGASGPVTVEDTERAELRAALGLPEKR